MGVAFLVVGGILFIAGFTAVAVGIRQQFKQKGKVWAVVPPIGGLMLFCSIVCGISGSVVLQSGNPLTDADIRAGRPCTATVLSVSDAPTGGRRDTDVFDFKIRVQPVDGSAYEVTVRDEVDYVEAGRAGAALGTTAFRCVIDRNDNSRVHVFWLDIPSPSPPSETTHT